MDKQKLLDRMAFAVEDSTRVLVEVASDVDQSRIKNAAIVCRNRLNVYISYMHSQGYELEFHDVFEYADHWFDCIEPPFTLLKPLVEAELQKYGDATSCVRFNEDGIPLSRGTERYAETSPDPILALQQCFAIINLEYLDEIIADSEEDPYYSAIGCRNRFYIYLLYKGMPQDFSSIDRYLTELGRGEDVAILAKKVQAEIDEFGHDRPLEL